MAGFERFVITQRQNLKKIASASHKIKTSSETLQNTPILQTSFKSASESDAFVNYDDSIDTSSDSEVLSYQIVNESYRKSVDMLIEYFY